MKSVLFIEAKEVMISDDLQFLEVMVNSLHNFGNPPSERTLGKVEVIRIPIDQYVHPKMGRIGVVVSPMVRETLVNDFQLKYDRLIRESFQELEVKEGEVQQLRGKIAMWKASPWYFRIWSALRRKI